MEKKAIYLKHKTVERLKQEAEEVGMHFSEYVRYIIENYPATFQPRYEVEKLEHIYQIIIDIKEKIKNCNDMFEISNVLQQLKRIEQILKEGFENYTDHNTNGTYKFYVKKLK